MAGSAFWEEYFIKKRPVTIKWRKDHDKGLKIQLTKHLRARYVPGILGPDLNINEMGFRSRGSL